MNTPIIMIHGFRGTHHGLALIQDALPEYTVYVPDLPGFGKAEPLVTHDLESYVAWLHLYIASLHLSEPPTLLGHSFGSIICAAYAAKYPTTITQLILVNPIGAPALEGPKAIMSKLALAYYWFGHVLPPKAARVWLSAKPIVFVMSTTMAKTKDKQLRHFIHAQHFAHFSEFYSPKTVSEAFHTSVTHNVRESAPAVSTPTLLIVGDQDDITTLAKQEELVRLFPDATLRVIHNVGHLTHYETPKEVAQLIQAFIISR